MSYLDHNNITVSIEKTADSSVDGTTYENQQQEYVDHYRDPITEGPPRGGVAIAFPKKLYSMLRAAPEEGFGHIISWQPHGRAFRIHDKHKFAKRIMPR